MVRGEGGVGANMQNKQNKSSPGRGGRGSKGRKQTWPKWFELFVVQTKHTLIFSFRVLQSKVHGQGDECMNECSTHTPNNKTTAAIHLSWPASAFETFSRSTFVKRVTPSSFSVHTFFTNFFVKGQQDEHGANRGWLRDIEGAERRHEWRQKKSRRCSLKQQRGLILSCFSLETRRRRMNEWMKSMRMGQGYAPRPRFFPCNPPIEVESDSGWRK